MGGVGDHAGVRGGEIAKRPGPAALDTALPGVHEFPLDLDIQHRLALPVVHSGEAGKLARALIGADGLDGIALEVSKPRKDVSPEIQPPAEQELFHFPSIEGDRPAVHFHPRNRLQHVLQHRILLNIQGVRRKDDRVADRPDKRLLGDDHRGRQRNGRPLRHLQEGHQREKGDKK